VRVAHVVRADAAHHIGGDLVQLHASVQALRTLGVDAFAASPEDAGEADVVHLYNLQLAKETFAARRAALRHSGSVYVLSPVFWSWADPTFSLRQAVPRQLRSSWRLGRQLLSDGAAVLPNSMAEMDVLERHFNIRRTARWVCVRNGVDFARWRTRQPGDGEALRARSGVDARWIVLCVARVEPIKNQQLLLEAVRLLDDTAVIFVGPPGDGAYASDLRREVDRTPRSASWLGPVAHQQLADVLPGAYVHVLPSLRETPGLATMEAAAAGLEIVAVRAGPTEEYFGPYAHWVDALTPTNLAAAIETSQREPKQPGLRQHIAAFDWTATARQLKEVYEAIVG
jgi:glycosyltransferase involved in cell wall biosynthesis